MSDLNSKTLLPCLMCGTILDNAIVLDGVDGPPAGGLVFSTSGNYGSTLFDMMDHPALLTVIICDACMELAARRRMVNLTTHRGTTLFDPDNRECQ